MKKLVSLSTAFGICAIATSVNAGNVADVDIVTFTANTAAKASEVNANFTKLKVENNDNDARITTNTNALAGATFFYGDGSAGDLTVSASVDWSSTPPTNYNLNFGNITINSGQTLTVPAGTTIRCNGSFTNNGTISVSTGVQPAAQGNWGALSTGEFFAIGHPGDSHSAAASGSYHNNGVSAPVSQQGGLGGLGITQLVAASRFHSFQFGGGSGAGYRSDASGGGAGGGLLSIYCKGATSVSGTGTISANGANAGYIAGGGGGGIVVLASTTSVTVAGTINANGGTGANSYSSGGGAGGGGGGGIVILAAPTVDSTAATISVSGGTGGTTTANVSTSARIGGGGGGASGGNGGSGGSISGAATGVPSTPGSGTAGYTLTLQQNPIYLMH